MFKLFENIFCISDSAIILKSAKDHENQVKSEISLLDNEVSKTKVKIEELRKFKKEVDLSSLKSMKSHLLTQKERMCRLTQDIDVIQTAVKLDRIKLSKPENFSNKLSEYNSLNADKELMSSLTELHKISKSMKELQFPKRIDVKDYKSLLSLQTELGILRKLLNIQLDTPFHIKHIDVNEYLRLVKIREDLQKLNNLLSLKCSCYSLKDTLEVYMKSVEYKKSLGKIVMDGKRAQERKREIVNRVEKLKNELKKYKVCPLCHQPINQEENI